MAIKAGNSWIGIFFLATLMTAAGIGCGGSGGGGSAADTTPPSAPTGLTAVAASDSRIDLTWAASTDNVGVAGYNVYRAASASGAPAKIGTSAANSYSDTGLTASTTYYYTVTAFDAANNESPASSQKSATTSSAGTTQLRVRVVNDYDDNAPLAGVTVVLGDSSGALVNSLTTDVNGEVTFSNPPANATVTSAVSGTSPYGTSQTLYSLHAFYDVNVPAFTISLTRGGIVTAGTANVHVSNSVISVTNWDIWPGAIFGSDVVDPVAIDIYPADVQSDGKVSFVAFGYDVNNMLTGFGTLVDQAFVSGMTTTVDLNRTDFTTLNTTFSNVPATAKGINWIDFGMSRKDGDFVYLSDGLILPVPAVHGAGVVAGYGDRFSYDMEILLDTNSDGPVDAYMGSFRDSTILANQTVDFSTYPSVPGNISTSGTGTARPTISWTGSDPAADEIWMSVYYSPSISVEYAYTIEAPVTRSAVQFPELPASLAAFRPTSWVGFPSVDVENDILDGVSGYNEAVVSYERLVNGTISSLSGYWSGGMSQSYTFPKPAALRKAAVAVPASGADRKRHRLK